VRLRAVTEKERCVFLVDRHFGAIIEPGYQMWHSGELSLAYLTVDGASPLEHIEAAAAAGFPAAGLRILPPVHLSRAGCVVGNPDLIRSVRTTCRQRGIRLLDAEVASLTASITADDIKAIVAAAAELQFRFVQTVIDDEDMSRAAANLAQLAEAAGRCGVGVALEFMAFRPLQNLESALSLIDRCGADNVGVLIDALHLARSGGSPETVAVIPAGRIAMAQLCDAPLASPAFDDLAAEARNERLYPGEGQLWLNELLDVLPDGLPISIEVPHSRFDSVPFVARAMNSKSALDGFLDARLRR
jgi:sugar phosphate isomerase/epimerase